MVVETEWMAAAETRMPTATKALAEREASMDGNVPADANQLRRPRHPGRSAKVGDTLIFKSDHVTLDEDGNALR